ncbi:MAG: phosphotransferase family protein [Methylobacteriaceae bacterium]|nr:phosphotransferase family protein [Methylobacteriaceae bacterium]
MSWDWDDSTLAALERFLAARGLGEAPPRPRRIGEGHSNLTYLIDVRGGQAVLRRPPPPPVPKGANDVLREARVLSALETQDVPTPRVLAIAQAGEALDVPFYVMTHIDGHIVTDVFPGAFDAARDGPAMTFGLANGLARLHAVDWRACGLGEFGQPKDFNTRHIRRLEGLMSVFGAPAPGLVEMAAHLSATAPPESGETIVHNDFRLGNVIWSRAAPARLMAILDWELATIGDPLFDLGYAVCCYPARGEPLNPTQELSAALLAEGVGARDHLIAHYAAQTGRDVSRLDWYVAMAAWKLAVLYDYQHRLARDAYYADATQAPRFLATAQRFARRA